MPLAKPDDMPRITPLVYYDNPLEALEYLVRVFGFTERMRLPDDSGGIMHAELTYHEAVVMMGPAAMNPAWQSPQNNDGKVCQSLYLYVDDVDAHHAATLAAGGEVVAELEDMFWGDRTYVAADCEGHRWTFVSRVKIVAPEDMQPPSA